jgi:hypothetical protein
MVERLLLITPEFYGIEKKIKSLLEDSGYEVTWIENKSLPFDYHGSDAKFKLLRRIYYFFTEPLTRYLKKELAKIKNHKFDLLLSINAHCISPYLFRQLKKQNPQIFSVLYLWDSFSMYDWNKEIKLFNKVYTFDPADSKFYQIEYKPNFWIKNNASEVSKNDYDLFFAGKFSSARMAFIDKVKNLPEFLSVRSYLKIWPAYKMTFHNSFLYSIIKILNPGNRWADNYIINYEAVEGILKKDYLINESQNFEYIHQLLSSSNVILDMPFSFQTGYTHRVVEALARGKKVITTNSNITKEDFYNPEQIKIVDHLNPQLDYNWIKAKSEFRVKEYFADLELSVWLKSLIDARNS